jgi:hypothetical protein
MASDLPHDNMSLQAESIGNLDEVDRGDHLLSLSNAKSLKNSIDEALKKRWSLLENTKGPKGEYCAIAKYLHPLKDKVFEIVEAYFKAIIHGEPCDEFHDKVFLINFTSIIWAFSLLNEKGARTLCSINFARATAVKEGNIVRFLREKCKKYLESFKREGSFIIYSNRGLDKAKIKEKAPIKAFTKKMQNKVKNRKKVKIMHQVKSKRSVKTSRKKVSTNQPSKQVRVESKLQSFWLRTLGDSNPTRRTKQRHCKEGFYKGTESFYMYHVYSMRIKELEDYIPSELQIILKQFEESCYSEVETNLINTLPEFKPLENRSKMTCEERLKHLPLFVKFDFEVGRQVRKRFDDAVERVMKELKQFPDYFDVYLVDLLDGWLHINLRMMASDAVPHHLPTKKPEITLDSLQPIISKFETSALTQEDIQMISDYFCNLRGKQKSKEQEYLMNKFLRPKYSNVQKTNMVCEDKFGNSLLSMSLCLKSFESEDSKVEHVGRIIDSEQAKGRWKLYFSKSWGQKRLELSQELNPNQRGSKCSARLEQSTYATEISLSKSSILKRIAKINHSVGLDSRQVCYPDDKSKQAAYYERIVELLDSDDRWRAYYGLVLNYHVDFSNDQWTNSILPAFCKYLETCPREYLMKLLFSSLGIISTKLFQLLTPKPLMNSMDARLRSLVHQVDSDEKKNYLDSFNKIIKADLTAASQIRKSIDQIRGPILILPVAYPTKDTNYFDQLKLKLTNRLDEFVASRLVLHQAVFQDSNLVRSTLSEHRNISVAHLDESMFKGWDEIVRDRNMGLPIEFAKDPECLLLKMIWFKEKTKTAIKIALKIWAGQTVSEEWEKYVLNVNRKPFILDIFFNPHREGTLCKLRSHQEEAIRLISLPGNEALRNSFHLQPFRTEVLSRKVCYPEDSTKQAAYYERIVELLDSDDRWRAYYGLVLNYHVDFSNDQWTKSILPALLKVIDSKNQPGQGSIRHPHNCRSQRIILTRISSILVPYHWFNQFKTKFLRLKTETSEDLALQGDFAKQMESLMRVNLNAWRSIKAVVDLLDPPLPLPQLNAQDYKITYTYWNKKKVEEKQLKKRRLKEAKLEKERLEAERNKDDPEWMLKAPIREQEKRKEREREEREKSKRKKQKNVKGKGDAEENKTKVEHVWVIKEGPIIPSEATRLNTDSRGLNILWNWFKRMSQIKLPKQLLFAKVLSEDLDIKDLVLMLDLNEDKSRLPKSERTWGEIVRDRALDLVDLSSLERNHLMLKMIWFKPQQLSCNECNALLAFFNRQNGGNLFDMALEDIAKFEKPVNQCPSVIFKHKNFKDLLLKIHALTWIIQRSGSYQNEEDKAWFINAYHTVTAYGPIVRDKEVFYEKAIDSCFYFFRYQAKFGDLYKTLLGYMPLTNEPFFTVKGILRFVSHRYADGDRQCKAFCAFLVNNVLEEILAKFGDRRLVTNDFLKKPELENRLLKSLIVQGSSPDSISQDTLVQIKVLGLVENRDFEALVLNSGFSMEEKLKILCGKYCSEEVSGKLKLQLEAAMRIKGANVGTLKYLCRLDKVWQARLQDYGLPQLYSSLVFLSDEDFEQILERDWSFLQEVDAKYVILCCAIQSKSLKKLNSVVKRLGSILEPANFTQLLKFEAAKSITGKEDVGLYPETIVDFIAAFSLQIGHALGVAYLKKFGIYPWYPLQGHSNYQEVKSDSLVSLLSEANLNDPKGRLTNLIESLKFLDMSNPGGGHCQAICSLGNSYTAVYDHEKMPIDIEDSLSLSLYLFLGIYWRGQRKLPYHLAQRSYYYLNTTDDRLLGICVDAIGPKGGWLEQGQEQDNPYVEPKVYKIKKGKWRSDQQENQDSEDEEGEEEENEGHHEEGEGKVSVRETKKKSDKNRVGIHEVDPYRVISRSKLSLMFELREVAYKNPIQIFIEKLLENESQRQEKKGEEPSKSNQDLVIFANRIDNKILMTDYFFILLEIYLMNPRTTETFSREAMFIMAFNFDKSSRFNELITGWAVHAMAQIPLSLSQIATILEAVDCRVLVEAMMAETEMLISEAKKLAQPNPDQESADQSNRDEGEVGWHAWTITFFASKLAAVGLEIASLVKDKQLGDKYVDWFEKHVLPNASLVSECARRVSLMGEGIEQMKPQSSVWSGRIKPMVVKALSDLLKPQTTEVPSKPNYLDFLDFICERAADITKNPALLSSHTFKTRSKHHIQFSETLVKKMAGAVKEPSDLIQLAVDTFNSWMEVFEEAQLEDPFSHYSLSNPEVFDSTWSISGIDTDNQNVNPFSKTKIAVVAACHREERAQPTGNRAVMDIEFRPGEPRMEVLATIKVELGGKVFTFDPRARLDGTFCDVYVLRDVLRESEQKAAQIRGTYEPPTADTTMESGKWSSKSLRPPSGAFFDTMSHSAGERWADYRATLRNVCELLLKHKQATWQSNTGTSIKSDCLKELGSFDESRSTALSTWIASIERKVNFDQNS